MEAMLLVGMLLGADPTYAEAFAEAKKDNRPVLVFVSAQWCGPCTSMKQNVLPRVRQQPWFRRVSFAVVDYDADPKLTAQLLRGETQIPQLVLFRKQPKGWLRSRVIGYQTEKQVQDFALEILDRK